MNWLASLKLEHREQRIAFEEMLLAVRQARERIERLEQAMREAVADWMLAPVVDALQAMRGMDMIGAITFWPNLAISRASRTLARSSLISASPHRRDRRAKA